MKDKHNQITATLPNTVSKRVVNSEERRRIAHRRYRLGFPRWNRESDRLDAFLSMKRGSRSLE
ncbi:MAG: hypothetical protein V7K97_15825 [Nostoc sp.]|uniref:hypothetical protein n=1 Tax=Nostoc sp. TaxID=1180 RepID=UPI002FF4CEB0